MKTGLNIIHDFIKVKSFKVYIDKNISKYDNID